MTTTTETRTKRAWQTLHSALDKHVKPKLPAAFVLAVSGGPDSRALLESIALWPRRLQGRWLVVSIDHGMRAQSAHEARFVAQRAQRLGFCSTVQTIVAQEKENEQSLRLKRYRLLAQAATSFGASYICCAHHRDDNAEGYLMALLGIGGGALGAAMKAEESMDEMVILRPFVGLGKNDLLLALSMSGYTDFAVDNLDLERAGQRAYVRHEILPMLSSHHPHVVNRLDYFARKEQEKKNALDMLSQALIRWSPDSARISLNPLPEPVLIEHAVRAILKKLCSHLDLRRSRPTVEKIIGHAVACSNVKAPLVPGLDRPPKWFILKGLKAKVYQLPGAEAYADSKEIVIKRL